MLAKYLLLKSSLSDGHTTILELAGLRIVPNAAHGPRARRCIQSESETRPFAL